MTRAEAMRLHLALLTAAESTLSRAMQIHLRRMARELAAAYSSGTERAVAEAVAKSQDVLFQGLARFYPRVTEPYARLAGAMLGDPTSLLHEQLVDQFIATRGLEASKTITQTSADIARAVIRDGEAEGIGVNSTARRLRDVFTSLSRPRSETIARTESHNAAMWAADEQANSMDVLEPTKEWLTTIDGNERDSHRAADGQTVPRGQPFVLNTGATCMTPGATGVASEDINCRCGVLYGSSINA